MNILDFSFIYYVTIYIHSSIRKNCKYTMYTYTLAKYCSLWSSNIYVLYFENKHCVSIGVCFFNIILFYFPLLNRCPYLLNIYCFIYVHYLIWLVTETFFSTDTYMLYFWNFRFYILLHVNISPFFHLL